MWDSRRRTRRSASSVRSSRSAEIEVFRWGRPTSRSAYPRRRWADPEPRCTSRSCGRAGTLDCEGWFDGGKGSGHFTYHPSPDFVAELAKRRRQRTPPTAWEQFQMTMAGVGVDLVDELARQKYDRPTAAELARMATHGVDLEYVRDIGARGYHLGDVKSLVRMRDHGVDREFIASLDSAGYRNLSAEELVRVRDHGVDGEYIVEMKAMGYAPSDPEELVESRDHGVDPSYVTSLRDAGYEH